MTECIRFVAISRHDIVQEDISSMKRWISFVGFSKDDVHNLSEEEHDGFIFGDSVV